MYTLLYLLCAAWLLWLMQGRSFIRNSDANLQHYQAASFYGQWLRDGLRNLLKGTGSFSQWSLSLGYGSDVLTTIHYYGLGDPLMLFSVFFHYEDMEFFYGLVILVRLFLAGLFTVLFFRRRGLGTVGAVSGALIFVFSGYGLNPAIIHPFFGIPMVCLPLLLLGVDTAYENRRYGFFILAVFLSAVSNMYFFYMLACFTALYAILRYFFVRRPFRFGAFLLQLLKFAGAALFACCLAAPILFPNVFSILSSDRMSVIRDRMLLYPYQYYAQMAAGTVNNFQTHYYFVSVSSVAVVCILLMIAAKPKHYLQEKLILLVLYLIAMIPIAGTVLNGGTYASNRWIWALVLAIAWCSARILTDLPSLGKKQCVAAVLLAVVFTALCILPRSISGLKIYLPLGVLWAALLLLLLFRAGKKLSAYRVVALFLTVISLLANIWLLFSPAGDEDVRSYIPAGTLDDRHRPEYMKLLAEQPDSGTVRFDQYLLRGHLNDAALNGLYSDSYYFSTIDTETFAFQRSQWLISCVGQHTYGLDHRVFLNYAMGVRYLALPKDRVSERGFGYDRELGQTSDVTVYASEDAPSIVYVFDSVLRQSAVQDILRRQEALLQCAVLPEEQATSLPDADPVFESRRLDYAVGPNTSGVSLQGDTIVVSYDYAVLELTFEKVPDCELYVLAEGITYDLEDVTDTVAKIDVNDGVIQRKITIDTPINDYYCGYEDFLLNMGYSEAGRDALRLTFRRKGTYHIESLCVAVQPMASVSAYGQRLKNSGVSELTVGQDSICFRTDRSDPGVACIAIPYNRGWTVTVDGKAAELLNVNGGLCGVELPAGEHAVELHYRTPILTASCLIAACAVLGLLIRTLWIRRRRSRHPGQS